MNKTGQTFRDPSSLILACLVALSLLGAWLYTKDAPGLDYYVAWVAADAVKNDSTLNIYESSSAYKLAVLYRNKADMQKDAPRQKELAAYRKHLPMTATPFLYWVTAMLSGGDYEKDLTRWHLLSLILLTASILVTCRVMGYPIATSLALMLPVVVWFTPFYSDLRVGNVNSFQLGLIGLIVWLQSRKTEPGYLFAAGLVTGLLVMFKPNLAPIAILLAGAWVVRQQFRQLAISTGGMMAGAFTAVLVSSFWMGSATAWIDWFGRVMRLVKYSPGESGGNYAVISQLISKPGPWGQLVVAIALCLLVLVMFWWGRKRVPASASDTATREQAVIENTCLVALGCIIMMLASTTVWLHYYLLSIPMLIVALRPWQENRKMGVIPILMLRVLPLIALVILMETALKTVIGSEGRSYWAMSTTTSALTLFVVGLWQCAYGFRVQTFHQQDPEPAAH